MGLAWFTMSLLLIAMLCSAFNFGGVSVIASVLLPACFVINFISVFYMVYKKKYVFILGALLFVLCYPFFFQISSEKRENEHSLSLLSFNVKSFSGNDEIVADNILRFINSINPDVLLLQESTYKIGRKITGYEYHFLGYQKGMGKSLLDIYSKFPIVDNGFLDFPESLNNSIYADLNINGDTVRVYNIHLQSFGFTSNIEPSEIYHKLSKTFNKQIEQAKLIKNHSALTSNHIIISGDLNSTIYSKPYRILSANLKDSFINKGKGLGSTYSFKGFPLRVDYALFDTSIEITYHKNFSLNLSDHEPIYIEFNIPKSLSS